MAVNENCTIKMVGTGGAFSGEVNEHFRLNKDCFRKWGQIFLQLKENQFFQVLGIAHFFKMKHK